MWGAGGILWEISVTPSQFFCKFKTALKNKIFMLKQTNKTLFRGELYKVLRFFFPLFAQFLSTLGLMVVFFFFFSFYILIST